MGNCMGNCLRSKIDADNEIRQAQEAGGAHSQQRMPAVLSRAVSSYNSTFTYEELEKATNGFSRGNYLGEGGFGAVYKGELEGGKKVAVKKLKIGGSQGDREFQSEVEIITRVHHRHLVALVGCCVAEDKRLLVYEFVANNSLRYHLHGMERGKERPNLEWQRPGKERPTMEWPIRFKIALGSAKGLAYLHTDCQPRIIHRDIKSDNILLDHHWEAKISDFGLARIFPDENTHIEVSRMAGTIGYFPPEYGATGELTNKSDVYSFGVILLELITGQLPPRLVSSVKTYLEREEYEMFVDPRLKKEYNFSEMRRMVKCAAACVRQNPLSRPAMNEVLLVLSGHLPVDSLNEQVVDGNKMHRSSTLNPSILSNGSGETGSMAFFSITSAQEQGNHDGNDEDDRTTEDSTHNPTLMLRKSPGRRVSSRTM